MALAPRTTSGKEICSVGHDQEVENMPENYICVLVILKDDIKFTIREVEVMLSPLVFDHQLPEDLNLSITFYIGNAVVPYQYED